MMLKSLALLHAQFSTRRAWCTLQRMSSCSPRNMMTAFRLNRGLPSPVRKGFSGFSRATKPQVVRQPGGNDKKGCIEERRLPGAQMA